MSSRLSQKILRKHSQSTEVNTEVKINSTMKNLLSGTVKIRSRRVPILWTGQNAEHIADNYVQQQTSTKVSNVERILHVEAQKGLSSAADHIKQEGSAYMSLKEVADGTIFVI